MDKLGLGKGLSALMGDDSLEEVQSLVADGTQIMQILIENLLPSHFQPRHIFDDSALNDLADSIREKGVLQPLLVRPAPNQTSKYEIIAGERRFRASKMAGLTQLPVIIKEFDDKAALEIALIDNLQRENLNPLEEAKAYVPLMKEFDYTQEELARVVGKSRSYVANMMRLLDLPQPVQNMLIKKEITIGHARSLLGVENAEKIAKEIVKKGLSVRQTEELVKEKPLPEVKSIVEKDKDVASLEKDLSELLGSKVTIHWNGKKGTVVIHYQSLEKLDFILQKLTHTT